MTNFKDVYKCEICGNIVEVMHSAGGTLVCCGKPMSIQKENTVDAAKEKHVPVIHKEDGKTVVKVGEVEHPMAEEHHIEWIEVHTTNKVYTKFLKPGEKPEAVFQLNEECVMVREYCNLHGLWKG